MPQQNGIYSAYIFNFFHDSIPQNSVMHNFHLFEMLIVIDVFKLGSNVQVNRRIPLCCIWPMKYIWKAYTVLATGLWNLYDSNETFDYFDDEEDRQWQLYETFSLFCKKHTNIL